MPAISVIVPSFNTKEQFLIRCVNSVIHQEFNDYELLLMMMAVIKDIKKFTIRLFVKIVGFALSKKIMKEYLLIEI